MKASIASLVYGKTKLGHIYEYRQRIKSFSHSDLAMHNDVLLCNLVQDLIRNAHAKSQLLQINMNVITWYKCNKADKVAKKTQTFIFCCRETVEWRISFVLWLVSCTKQVGIEKERERSGSKEGAWMYVSRQGWWFTSRGESSAMLSITSLSSEKKNENRDLKPVPMRLKKPDDVLSVCCFRDSLCNPNSSLVHAKTCV